MTGVPTYRTTVGSQSVDLPLVPLTDDCTIALLICVDLGVGFTEIAGRELAEQLAPFRPELVVSVATMGIPLAIEVSRSLGLDDYVILHKTPKIHLGEAFVEPVRPSPPTASRPSGWIRSGPSWCGVVGWPSWTMSSPPGRPWPRRSPWSGGPGPIRRRSAS